MITEEIMKSGEMYNSMDAELFELQWEYNDLMYEYNSMKPSDRKGQQRILKKLLGDMGEGCVIEPPLRANWGKNTHLGNRVYANFNLTLVDDADVYIGDDVMIGPNVTIATAGHPLDAELRKKGMQFNKSVHIGSGVWLGSGVIILPGVTIGEKTTIGAGSVVTKDIPANVVAYGNPCRIRKNLSFFRYHFFCDSFFRFIFSENPVK